MNKVLLGLILLASNFSVQAITLLNTATGCSLNDGGSGVTATNYNATKFTTTAGTTTLSRVTIYMANNGAPATGSYGFYLYSDSSGHPNTSASNTLLYTGDATQLPGVYSPITVSNLSVPVSPSTVYWIVVAPIGPVSHIDTNLITLGCGGTFAGDYPNNPNWYTNTAWTLKAIIEANIPVVYTICGSV